MKVHDINQMVALYLALQPLPQAYIAEHVHDTQSQRILIDQLISNAHTIAYPPATDYQRKFWKNVVAALEGKGVEIEEEIYERLICTLNTPVKQGPPEASYLTYLLSRPESCTISTTTWRRPPDIDNFSQDYRPLTIRESRTTIERGTTGLRTWRASLDLAEWALQNHPASPSVHVRALDWEDSVNEDRRSFVRTLLEEIDADVILAADVVYDPSIIPPLTCTLRLALERPFPTKQAAGEGANNVQSLQPGSQRKAYVALTLRREQTFAEFLASAEQEGLGIEFIEMNLPPHNERVFRGSDDSSSGSTVTTRLMRLTVRSV
ncbi:unnamed protein product [Rhizoctonia solani]|uniref:Uncharacterized protein n=1 Tax=Rhizoctonia solani TaxID=456999 RepID=A0A8H3GXM3_9AGAM|nr:unnamed protein product [Rhizoctonia solani]